MNKRREAELLAQAADLIAEACATLDTAQRECTECGVTHYRNYADARVHERISVLPSKLREQANRLNNNR